MIYSLEEVKAAKHRIELFNTASTEIRSQPNVIEIHSRDMEIIKEDEFRKINNHYSLCVFSFELGIKKEYDKQRIREAVRKHRLHKKLGIKKKKPLTNAECQRRWRERHPEKAKKHNDALNRKAKAKRAAQRLANI